MDIKGSFEDFKAIRINTSDSNISSFTNNEEDQFLSFVSNLPVKILNEIKILHRYL